MPRDASERPARRLDAILGRLRAHRVQSFKAADLPGIGSGIEFTFAPDLPAPVEPETAVTPAPTRGRFERDERPQPIDELDLVSEGREGPIPS